MRPGTLLWALLISSVLLCTSCTGGVNSEIKQYVDSVLQRKGVKIEPLPELQQYEAHRYSSAELRNPFEPDKKASTTNNNSSTIAQPDTNRPKEELERFGLDALHMVGVLTHGGVRWALVSAPNGGVYRVSVGNYIGKNYGKVQKILNDRLVIVETIPDGEGGWIYRKAELELENKE